MKKKIAILFVCMMLLTSFIVVIPISSIDNEKHFTLVNEESSFNPFFQGWRYRKQITMDHTKVEGNLNDFPVLVNIVNSDLCDKVQIDGDDILFMDDTGVANSLAHEIELYDSSSGKLVAWVNIPSLSSSKDTVIYMYYGNPSCANQQTPEHVWDSNFKAVWHICEDGVGKRFDSTSNNYDGTPYNYDGDEAATGFIGGADHFDGSDDYIKTGVSFDYNYRTVSFWFNADIIPSGEKDNILTQDSNDLLYGSIKANLLNGEFRSYAAGLGEGYFTFDVQNEIWYMVHLIRDGSQVRYYVDGDLKHTSTSGSGGSSSNPNKNLVIAVNRYHEQPFDGILDEVRVSNIARSDDWIATEYNNQNDPSGFFNAGYEESSTAISRNKIITETFLMRILERFPNAFPIMKYILELTQ